MVRPPALSSPTIWRIGSPPQASSESRCFSDGFFSKFNFTISMFFSLSEPIFSPRRSTRAWVFTHVHLVDADSPVNRLAHSATPFCSPPILNVYVLPFTRTEAGHHEWMKHQLSFLGRLGTPRVEHEPFCAWKIRVVGILDPDPSPPRPGRTKCSGRAPHLAAARAASRSELSG